MPEPEATDAVHETLGALETELERLKAATEHIDASKEAARDTVKAASKAVEACQTLAAATQALHDRINEVDFARQFREIEKRQLKAHEEVKASFAQAERDRISHQEEIEDELAHLARQQKTWFSVVILIMALTLVIALVAAAS